jgi:hypothetical protein
VKHPPADRARVIVDTLFPPPNQKHLWEQPLRASDTTHTLLHLGLFPHALQRNIVGTIDIHPPRDCNL